MQENCISASVMLSEYFKQIIVVLAFVMMCFAGPAPCKVIDRVVASIDEQAITESELREKHQELLQIDKDITVDKALRSIINRKLLLKDAKKFKMEGKEDEVIEKYIDMKIRALIVIQDKAVRKYFNDHKEEFRGKRFETVYKDIVKYLTELRVNEELKIQIEKLRSNASIKIMLDEAD